ncbi:fungal-specific transcription factor domain-containing protein [Lentinula raphanica]|nr:fungal-specific transcription factor domain-containing protein [Lentinula raphanica]
MTSKAPRACDQCRSRKIRCDNILQAGKPCTKCVGSDIQCTFTYVRKKRKPNIATAQSKRSPLDSVRSLIEEILSSSRYTPPSDPETVREIIVSLAKYARSLDDHSTRLRKAMLGDDTSLATSPSEQAPQVEANISDEYSSDDDVNSEAFNKISLGHSSVRHFGKSSNIRFIHDVMNKGQTGERAQLNLDLARSRRPEYWGLDVWKFPQVNPVPAYEFPEIDLLWDFINIYFNKIAPFFPLLHRPTFENAVVSGLHLLDSEFAAVVLAVCAIAARESDDPRVFRHDTKVTAGWQWLRQIRLVRPHFVMPTSLYELQLLSLACVYLRHTNMLDSVWSLAGLSVRLAMDRGVHRMKPGNARTVESELYIRAFWILRNIDVVQGMIMGRSTAVNSEDFDIDMPAECDDEFWEKGANNEAFTQPVGKISVLSFLTQYTKLLDIAASVRRNIYCIREVSEFQSDNLSSFERNRKKVMQHDSMLNNWLSSLPEHLRWDPHRPDLVRLGQSAILYTTYYWIQLQVHKLFITRQDPTNQQVFPSFVICANAARSTVRVAQVTHRKSKNQFEVLFNLAHGSTILKMILWRHKHGISPTPHVDIDVMGSDIKSVIEILSAADSSSQTMGRIVDKIRAFINAEGLLTDLPVPATSTSKRARQDEDDLLIDSLSRSEIPDLEHQETGSVTGTLTHTFDEGSTIAASGTTADFDPYSFEGRASSPLAYISAARETHMSFDDKMQHDWDSFMKNVDEVLLAIGFN